MAYGHLKVLVSALTEAADVGVQKVLVAVALAQVSHHVGEGVEFAHAESALVKKLCLAFFAVGRLLPANRRRLFAFEAIELYDVAAICSVRSISWVYLF